MPSDARRAHPHVLGRRAGTAPSRCARDGFPDDVWIHGVIVNLKRSRNGHVYFDLCDLVEAGQPPLASLPVALFKMNKDVVNALLKRTGNIRMEDGVQVRIRGVVTFYPPTGRLQLRMTSIDPSYTLGSMAADRDRVLKSSPREGLIDATVWSRCRPLPCASVSSTAAGSAAYHDFMTELSNSNIHGRSSTSTCRSGCARRSRHRAALAHVRTTFRRCHRNVRGGGSRTDLMASTASSWRGPCAASPAPVFTGSDTTDRAIADEVAQPVYKTPTRVRAALVRTGPGLCPRLRERVDARPQRARAILDAHESATIGSPTTRHRRRRDCSLRIASRAVISRSAIAAETNHALSRAPGPARPARAGAVGTARRQVRQATRALDQHRGALPVRAARALVEPNEPSTPLPPVFAPTTPPGSSPAASRDPRADGSVVRSAADLTPNDEVLTTFTDGTARARVLSVDRARPSTWSIWLTNERQGKT